MKYLLLLALISSSSVALADNEYEKWELDRAKFFSTEGNKKTKVEKESLGEEGGGQGGINTVGTSQPSAEPTQATGNSLPGMPAGMGMPPGMTLPPGMAMPQTPPMPGQMEQGSSGRKSIQGKKYEFSKEEAEQYGKALKELRDKHGENNMSNEYVNDVFSEIDKIQNKPSK